MNPPFDLAHLDRLMDDAGLEALVVTSKHNVRYLLGGHQCDFFQHMDAVGVSRYLPIVVYVKGRPEDTHYVAWAGEHWELEVQDVWVPSVETASYGSVDSAQRAAECLSARGLTASRIGVEPSFIPADALDHLRLAMPEVEFLDSFALLEELRACKSQDELALVEACSKAIVDSMLEVFANATAGVTKEQLVRDLREAQTARNLTYEYCLVSMGADLNRARSKQSWLPGEVVSMDSGGQLKGYIGDVARMAVMGPPDAELRGLLDQIHAVQEAARSKVAAGEFGETIFSSALEALRGQRDARYLSFVAHGMGLISHEAPRLTANGPILYEATHARRPLEPGMVLSLETWMEHPRRGFIKIEDTVALTDNGYTAFADYGRGWNVAG